MIVGTFQLTGAIGNTSLKFWSVRRGRVFQQYEIAAEGPFEDRGIAVTEKFGIALDLLLAQAFLLPARLFLEPLALLFLFLQLLPLQRFFRRPALLLDEPEVVGSGPCTAATAADIGWRIIAVIDPTG